MKKSLGWGGWSGVGLNPILVSALAPFGLVKVGAEIGAELDNNFGKDKYLLNNEHSPE